MKIKHVSILVKTYPKNNANIYIKLFNQLLRNTLIQKYKDVNFQPNKKIRLWLEVSCSGQFELDLKSDPKKKKKFHIRWGSGQPGLT